MNKWRRHAPRERVSWNAPVGTAFWYAVSGHAPRERVSWNRKDFFGVRPDYRHAPRERVSWNCRPALKSSTLSVTLHVSVWVEIVCATEIFQNILSRSTWACELKFKFFLPIIIDHSHAPRERVSWNAKISSGFAPIMSRSTWACELKYFGHLSTPNWVQVTLHVSVWVEICAPWGGRRSVCVTLHVSVWVEIIKRLKPIVKRSSHAPRERVSWNCIGGNRKILLCVTLHVSVWVEIFCSYFFPQFGVSRSTWACELKSLKPSMIALIISSRSTWACELKSDSTDCGN